MNGCPRIAAREIVWLVGAIVWGGLPRHICAEEFTVNRHHFVKHGAPLLIKGVVYVPAYPGSLPWELAEQRYLPVSLKASIVKDLRRIRAMGANTIRLWDAPAFCYQAIKRVGGLAILQTIWLDGQQPDFQTESFKQQCRQRITTVIDRIYAATSSADPPAILAFLVGNELDMAHIERTDREHPELRRYEGTYVSAPDGSTATQCFLAEMADFAKTYEQARYGRTHLISYANEVRAFRLLDTPFLDFRSVNAYSYALHERDGSAPSRRGHATGTPFQGWIEYLKQAGPERPLLMTETGLSVAPNIQVGPPGDGYGGNTLSEQAEGLAQRWRDVVTATPPIAGLCIHEYLDAWWKFGRGDSMQHEPDDVEEWFGLVSIEPEGRWYRTRARPAYRVLKALWSK